MSAGHVGAWLLWLWTNTLWGGTCLPADPITRPLPPPPPGTMYVTSGDCKARVAAEFMSNVECEWRLKRAFQQDVAENTRRAGDGGSSVFKRYAERRLDEFGYCLYSAESTVDGARRER